MKHHASARIELLVVILAVSLFAAVAVADDATLAMTRSADQSLNTWHFHAGVPFAKDVLRDASHFTLYRDGKPIPAQTRAVATWGPEGSIKWLAVDFVDSATANQQNQYTFSTDATTTSQGSLRVNETADHIQVNNGRLNLRINKAAKGFNLFDSVTLDGRDVWSATDNIGPYIVDGEGVTYRAALDGAADVRVESAGPLAAVIRAEGWFVNPKSPRRAVEGEPIARPDGGFCRFVTRIYIAANQPDVRVQHTFINTEDSEVTTWQDIGINLPAVASSASYGEGDPVTGHSYLLQKSFDAYDVNQVVGADNITTLRSGERALGVIRAGDVAVGIRDFWQNFPKELEYDPAAKQIRVHLWPRHGSPRIETAEQMNDDNAWRLPFAHSGKELDFRPPQTLRDEKDFPEFSKVSYLEGMYASNAIGISRTHDLMISFAGDDAMPRLAAFNDALHVLPDPIYIDATDVLGPVPAIDNESQPLIEHYVAGGLRWLIRALEECNSTGMWNFGDTNTFYNIKGGKIEPQYHRLWSATHYNTMRAAWWTYMRGGDPVILRHAQRQASHIMDVDICHWTNAKFTDNPVQRASKAVGGLCDYKGIVHWTSGDRNAYNACIDYLLCDYYLTGNGRAWDVAMEHGYYVKDTGKAYVNREAAGQLDTLVDLYQATWDPQVKEKLDAQFQRVTENPANVKDPMISWTPWMRKYWDLTHDPAIKEFQLKRMAHPESGSRLYDYATAYDMTGDRQYAVECAKQILFKSLDTTVRKDQYDGIFGRSVKGWIDTCHGVMLALPAAEAAKLSFADFPIDEWHNWTGWGISSSYITEQLATDYFKGTWPWPKDLGSRRRISATLYHDGSNKTLWLGNIQQGGPRTEISLYAPDGSLIKQHVNEGYWRVIVTHGKTIKRTWDRSSGKAVTVDLATEPFEGIESAWALAGDSMQLGPNHPTGFYRVVWEGDSYFHPVPILPPDEKVWLETGDKVTASVSGFKYFYVPADCEKFELAFLPDYTKDRFYQKLNMATGAILNPDVKPVASISCGLETEPQVIAITVPAKHRGKTWCIAGSGYALVRMTGVPPYISPTYETFTSEPRTPMP